MATSTATAEAAAAIATINHFTHPYPNHDLKPTNTGPERFVCGACKNPGTGAAYRCENPTCAFTLHATCTSISDKATLDFFLHPQHPLRLLTESSLLKLKSRIFCDLCKEYVHGMWYRCAPCNSDVHPICAHLPRVITDGAHPDHEMSLQAGPISGYCSRCGVQCKECYYGCTECEFVSHLECLLDVSGPVFCYRVAHTAGPISPPQPRPQSSSDGKAKDKTEEGEKSRDNNENADQGLRAVASTLDIVSNLINISN